MLKPPNRSKPAFVYDRALSLHELSPEHPFKPLRLELTRTLAQTSGLLDSADEVAPEPLSRERLLTLHDPDYVAAVEAVSHGEDIPNAQRYGLGTTDNPIFPNMHEAILAVCGASVTAARLVASGEVTRAASFSGGLHHAMHNRMSGFCTYNDAALAIHEVVTHYGQRVAYIDIDAHHGDGVQDLFYDSAEVMTFSVHESGRYLFPGTGFIDETGRGEGRGLSLNLPLEPFTEDASYLAGLEAVLPRALSAFGPDLIVRQAGADMHDNDPLSHLNSSAQGIVRSYRLISDLADEFCGGRLVALGGGGYDPYRTVPRLWTLLWAVLSRQSIPETVPEVWRESWAAQLGVVMPAHFSDNTESWAPIHRRADIERANALTAQKLLATLEPIWQGR